MIDTQPGDGTVPRDTAPRPFERIRRCLENAATFCGPTDVEGLNDSIESAVRAGVAARYPREFADQLHAIMEDRRLTSARDGKGRTPRSTCVAALLQLGFPYALEVHPAQLAAYRRDSGTANLSLKTQELSFAAMLSFALYAAVSLWLGNGFGEAPRPGTLGLFVSSVIGLVCAGVTVVHVIEPLRAETLKRIAALNTIGVLGSALAAIAGPSRLTPLADTLPLLTLTGLTWLAHRRAQRQLSSDAQQDV